MFQPELGLPFDHDMGLHYIESGGEQWRLAALPPTDYGLLPKFAASNLLIPRAQWHDIDLSVYAAPMLRQIGGSCVGHGSVTAFALRWAIQGNTPQQFSACWIYGEINNGRDQGAVISDSLKCMQTKGVALLSEVPEGMLYSRQFPPSAAQTALRYRADQATHAQSFDELASGILVADPAVLGMCVGANFTHLDQYGVAGITRGQGNHCLCGVGLKKLPDGRWGIKTQNSWGASFGQNGFCYLVEEHFNTRYNSPDWYLLQSLMDDPQELNLPPEMG